MINGAEPVLTEDLLVPYELEPYQPFRPFIHSYHITTTPRHHQGAQLGNSCGLWYTPTPYSRGQTTEVAHWITN